MTFESAISNGFFGSYIIVFLITGQWLGNKVGGQVTESFERLICGTHVVWL